MAVHTMGSQIEYHHCGTPMPGEVSSKRKSSHTTRTLSAAIRKNRMATMAAPNWASPLRRAMLPLSAKYSMRMCRSRATAAEPATMASRIIRNTENSSVHAKDWSVK